MEKVSTKSGPRFANPLPYCGVAKVCFQTFTFPVYSLKIPNFQRNCMQVEEGKKYHNAKY